MITKNSRFSFIALLLLCTGCLSDSKDSDGKEADKDLSLSAEIAKKALLDMISKPYPGVLVDAPEDKPIVVLNENEVAIGIWECNLKAKTFGASKEYPRAPRHKYNWVEGVFERKPGGGWVAKVTSEKSADNPGSNNMAANAGGGFPMKDQSKRSISHLITDHNLIAAAVQRAVREAARKHAEAGQPVATWRDGKVVWIPAQEVLARLSRDQVV
jgi:hypothetical protein